MAKPQKIGCNEGLLCGILMVLQRLQKQVKKVEHRGRKKELTETVEEIMGDFACMVGPKFLKEVRDLPDEWEEA